MDTRLRQVSKEARQLYRRLEERSAKGSYNRAEYYRGYYERELVELERAGLIEFYYPGPRWPEMIALR